MHAAHGPITTDENRGGPGIQIYQLRHLLPHLSRRTRDQICVFHAVLGDEGPFALQAALLFGFFEVQRDDGQALSAVLLVQLHEVLGLVMAVRAPSAGHDGQDHLALEARILIGDQPAIRIREIERELLVRIACRGMSEVIIRRRQALGSGNLGAIRDIVNHGRSQWTFAIAVVAFPGRTAASLERLGVGFIVSEYLQGAILTGGDLDDAGAVAIEVAEHPFAVLERTAVSAGVAVHAQDGGADLGAMLLNNQPKCLLALGGWRIQRNLPAPGDIGRSHRGGEGGSVHVPHGMKAIFNAVTGTHQGGVPDQFAVFELSGDGGEVVLRLQNQFAVLEGHAGRRIVGFGTIVERTLQARART